MRSMRSIYNADGSVLCNAVQSTESDPRKIITEMLMNSFGVSSLRHVPATKHNVINFASDIRLANEDLVSI